MTMRCLALGFLLTVLAPCSGQRLAFVDVEEVILRYKKTAALTQDLEEQLKQKEVLLRQRFEALQSKKQSVDEMEEDTLEKSLEKLRKMKEIRGQEEELKIEQEYALVGLEQQVADHMKKVYSEVITHIAALARERSISAVWMVQKNEIKGTSRERVEANIVVRPVLWYDPNLDLTGEVIRTLNGQ